MYSIKHEALKRSIRVMQLIAAGEESTPGVGSLIPTLMDPEILTFSSARGMMIAGFEEIDGRRYYQAWLLHRDGH